MSLHALVKNRCAKALTMTATPGLQYRQRQSDGSYPAEWTDLVGNIAPDRPQPMGYDERRNVAFAPQTGLLKCPDGSDPGLNPEDQVKESSGTIWVVQAPLEAKGQGVYAISRRIHPGRSAGGNRGRHDG